MRRRTSPGTFQPARLVIILLIAAAIALVWERWRFGRSLRDPQHLVALANALEEDSATARHAQLLLETRHLARDEFARLQAILEELHARLVELKPKTHDAAARLQRVLESSDGYAVAANEKLLIQLHGLLEEYRPEEPTVDLLFKRCETLRIPVEQTIQKDNYEKPPEPELVERIHVLDEEASRQTELQADFDRRLDAILHAAGGGANSGATVAQVLADLKARWAAEANAKAAEVAEEVRAEYARKLVTEKAESERLIGEAALENERVRREAKLAADRQEAETEARRVAETTENARQAEARRVAAREASLRAEAEEREYQAALPDLERYLSGFITPGHQQLVAARWVYTEEAKPLSLSALKARHCLRQDDTGYMYFGTCAGSDSNDRPGGALDGYNGQGHVPPGMLPDIVKAQGLLLKYADKLIEHGRLLP